MMKAQSVLTLFATFGAISICSAAEQSIVLASTTSVEASGLLANILPQFTAKTGIAVNVVAQGTGRRWTPRVEAMRTCCWFTIRKPNNNSWTKATARPDNKSHGMILSLLGRPLIRLMFTAAVIVSRL